MKFKAGLLKNQYSGPFIFLNNPNIIYRITYKCITKKLVPEKNNFLLFFYEEI